MMVVADIGASHGGDVQKALQLVDAAADAGCRLVKLSAGGHDAAELSLEAFGAIDEHCRRRGIPWFACTRSETAMQMLDAFDLDYAEVPADLFGEIALLSGIAARGRHTFIHTGSHSWAQIDTVLTLFSGVPYTLIHSAGEGPIEDEAANLRAMKVMRHRFACPVGYAGREAGTLVSALAVALGADVIERRLSLEGNGTDVFSPAQMKALVEEIGHVQRILGDGAR